jgi:hypothetical protein
MLRPGVLPLCLVALCTACQPQPKVYSVERARTYAQGKAAVWDGVLRFLQANDFSVVSADLATGIIHAERTGHRNDGWADCERAWVINRSSDSPRPRRARPLSRDLALEVVVRQTSVGAEAQPVARFTEQQNDPWRNLPLTQPCRSTGVLERALLDPLAPRRGRRGCGDEFHSCSSTRSRARYPALQETDAAASRLDPAAGVSGKTQASPRLRGSVVEDVIVNLAE